VFHIGPELAHFFCQEQQGIVVLITHKSTCLQQEGWTYCQQTFGYESTVIRPVLMGRKASYY
ncbi:hypothetical protein ACFL3A_09340, partial [Pseudomonadota bacterium]